MTAILMNRRSFLRGSGRVRRAPIRPPWALEEAAFIAACTRCKACIEHCPPAILIAGEGAYPEVDFSRGECTFCGDCLQHCEPAALQGKPGIDPPWQLALNIGENCLARQGVECRVCGENCPEVAIRFRLRLGGVALPLLDAQACSGCGACVAPCPTQAIAITPDHQFAMETMA